MLDLFVESASFQYSVGEVLYDCGIVCSLVMEECHESNL